jgi:hypothetical protein
LETSTGLFISFVDNSRRGAPESEGITVLLTHSSFPPKQKPRKPTVSEAVESKEPPPDPSKSPLDSIPDVFQPFVKKLQSSGHIVDFLNVNKYRATCIAEVPQTDPPLPRRRITFHFVRWNAFVYAALHETGSPAFWLGLRDRAAKLGFELTRNHLQKCTQIFKEVFGQDATQYFEETAQTREYKEDGLVYFSSEEDVFRFLDMKYVPPHERNW